MFIYNVFIGSVYKKIMFRGEDIMFSVNIINDAL